MNNNILVDEFRGTDELYCAKVLTDNNEDGEGYTTDEPFKLAPVAEISKTTETASETKYYDNLPANSINVEGSDTITLTVPVLPVDVLGAITGKKVDATTGALMDGDSEQSFWALGYRLGLTDGSYRYVWRYKGRFGTVDETSATKNAGTDTNNQTLTYTGIACTYNFEKAVDSNGNQIPQKALVVDEREGKAWVEDFFDEVTTCDTLKQKLSITNALTNCTTSNTASAIAKGDEYEATIAAEDGYQLDEITVTMGGTDVTATAVTDDTIAIATVTGALVITATAVEE